MTVALLLAIGLTASPADFEHCAATLGDDTRGHSTAMCVRKAADAQRQWESAIAWLETAWQRHPSSGWLALHATGARAGVGTLWAIRNHHAAQFADAMYASLARERRSRTRFRQRPRESQVAAPRAKPARRVGAIRRRRRLALPASDL